MKNNFIKTLEILSEMPLPKDTPKDHLVPRSGDYRPSREIDRLRTMGPEIGVGSSRIAFHIKVEEEQFKGGTDLDIVNGMADTVIKIARDSRGIAQNDEEIKIYKKFKNNPLLLPIIDSSRNHSISIGLSDPKTKKKTKTTSNWIQMPLAKVYSNYGEFDIAFKKSFGDLWKALHELNPKKYNGEENGYSFQALTMRTYEDLKQIAQNDNKFVNEKQRERLRYLFQLVDAGLNIVDLDERNMGVYKGNIVILDYGFTKKTADVYYGNKVAVAKVEDDGDVTLQYV